MSRKEIKFVREPVYLESDGTFVPYIDPEIKNNRDAYAASLNILFKHLADFHIGVVDIIAEKYKLDAGEIINVILQDEKYKNMKEVSVNDLGHIVETTEPKVEVKKVRKTKLKVEEEPIKVTEELLSLSISEKKEEKTKVKKIVKKLVKE